MASQGRAGACALVAFRQPPFHWGARGVLPLPENVAAAPRLELARCLCATEARHMLWLVGVLAAVTNQVLRGYLPFPVLVPNESEALRKLASSHKHVCAPRGAAETFPHVHG